MTKSLEDMLGHGHVIGHLKECGGGRGRLKLSTPWSSLVGTAIPFLPLAEKSLVTKVSLRWPGVPYGCIWGRKKTASLIIGPGRALSFSS